MKLCEAFNVINSKFGANRVSLISSWGDEAVEFGIVGFGRFELRFAAYQKIEVVEVGVTSSIFHSKNSEWLTAIATGKVRNADGKMVAK